MPGVVLGALTIALAYAAAFLPRAAAAAPWLMLGGIVLLIVALCLLGTRRAGRSRPAMLGLGFGLLGLVLLGGFGAALVLPPESPATPLLLGLPRRAALVVYGIGIVPALFLPLVYALSFDRAVLSGAELQEIRTRLAGLSADQGAP
jgi:hypothetical protein